MLPPLPRTEVPDGSVHLAIAAAPGNVRLARLVAVSVGRLHGMDGPQLDDLRLAVGEACGRAVLVHAEIAPRAPVLVDIDGGADALAVTVSSHEVIRQETPEQRRLPEPFAILGGLADEVDLRSDAAGTTVQLRWRLNRLPP